MNTHQAKSILARHRPGTADDRDPEIAKALKVTTGEPQLREWLKSHIALQTALQTSFRQLPVPDGLRERIIAMADEQRELDQELGRREAAKRAGWFAVADFGRRNWMRLAVAAAVLILAGLGGIWWSEPTEEGTQLADFRGRMVRAVLREYMMDIHTADMEEVRHYLRTRNAPADYRLPGGLENLSVAGGGLVRWRNEPVSMVCFDRGGGGLLFLFVISRESVADEPGSLPDFEQVNRLMTASWSADDRVYVLAGEVGEAALREYF